MLSIKHSLFLITQGIVLTTLLLMLVYVDTKSCFEINFSVSSRLDLAQVGFTVNFSWILIHNFTVLSFVLYKLYVLVLNLRIETMLLLVKSSKWIHIKSFSTNENIFSVLWTSKPSRISRLCQTTQKQILNFVYERISAN